MTQLDWFGREVEAVNDPEILPTLRAGDTARERIIDRLGDALVSGHLPEAEFRVRLNAAVTGRTHVQLDRLVADLPDTLVPADSPQPSPPCAVLRVSVRTVLEAGAVAASFVLGSAVMIISVVLFSNVAWGAGIFLAGFFPWIVSLALAGKVGRRARARRRSP